MDDPRNELQAALKDAMKNKDTMRRNVIRVIMSGIKQVEIDEQRELETADVLGVIQKEAKQRRETIAEREGAGRDVEQDKQELAIVESFLPKQLTDEEIKALVQDVLDSTGASGMGDMGKVMGALMPKVKGRADGKRVNAIVRELLS